MPAGGAAAKVASARVIFKCLAFHPCLRPKLDGPEPLLVDDQKCRVVHPISERRSGQDAPACRRGGGNKSAATGERIEIFDDNAAIIEFAAIIEDQHRNLAKWILRLQRIVWVVGIGENNLDRIVQAKQIGGDLYLPSERRSRRRTQNHHRSLPLMPLGRATGYMPAWHIPRI